VNRSTHILDLWLNNEESVYSFIFHEVDSDEELQYYVEALLYTGDAFSHGIIKDLLGDVNWRELFESIKGV
jgi:hypothetical protein